MYICQVAKVAQERLSRDRVTDGALALIDAEGLDALTIRRLAQRLGVTPMALYWHFKNKDELLDGVAGRLWEQVDRRRDTSKPLLDQLRALVESLIAVLRQHREVVALLLVPHGREPGEAYLHATETALSILFELGFDAGSAAQICQNGLRTATALVLGEPGAATPGQTPEERSEATRRKRLLLESLSPSRYPSVVAAAGPLTCWDDPDAHYDFGVDLFMAGVAAMTSA